MLKNILKGIIIGLANILPGVSGGTMAVSMGLYDKLIHCVNHLFSEFKKSMLFLLPIAVGMGIAIMGSVFGIDYFFETFPMQTNFLFIGLILGSLPSVYQKVKNTTIRIGHIVSAVIFFVVVVGLALLNGNVGNEVVLKVEAIELIKLFLVGVIASATMIIPGISGSMMLLLMGYYNPILDSIKAFIVAVLSWNMGGIVNGFCILVPFGMGVIVGMFAIAKLIEAIFQKYETYAYWSILGLIVASPIAILFVASLPRINIIRILASAVTFVFGYVASVKLGEK